MSFICYDENQPRSARRLDFESADATRFYLEHYRNRLYLSFLANHSQTTFSEKAQARKELDICDRKLEYWRKHPRFRAEVANQEIVKLQKEWRQE